MYKRIFKAVTAVCFAAVFIGSNALAAEFSDNVYVNNGCLQGVYDEKYDTVKWLGIPYAETADKEKRWKAPALINEYDGIIDCSKAADSNIQYNGKTVVGKEGILTLDIYRPDTKETDLPVVVFVHGGNNQTSNSRLWIGDKFAKEANVVYVSIQYRLGLLGFNNLPALHTGNKSEDSGNYGLLDQAAALDWIKNNISQFGGNKNNITVSGFSAGGRDVMIMLISPLFKNKFDKAISFSGGLTTADYEESQKIIAENLAPLAVEDGMCKDTESAEAWLLSDGDDVEQYLRNLSAERLAPIMAGAVIRMNAFPHLYADGKVIPKNGFATKKFNSVPLLMLASEDEFSSFVMRDSYFKNRLDKIKPGTYDGEEFAFANKYGSEFYRYFNGHEAAEKISKYYKDDIYVCRFMYGHDPAVAGEDYALNTGAVHGVFLPFLTDQEYPYTKKTDIFTYEGSKELSRIFIDVLADFVKTGKPESDLLKDEWKPWNLQEHFEMVFDADQNKANVYLNRDTTTYESIMEKLELDNSIKEKDKDYIIRNVLNERWFSAGLDNKYKN